jgi:hypothetical protein
VWKLRIVVRVPDPKHKEFVTALETLPGMNHGVPDTVETYQGLDDRTRICWEASWKSEADARRFLNSDAYRALRGAALVVGDLESIELAVGESFA